MQSLWVGSSIKYSFFFICIILLSSCLTVSTKMTLNSNGSGTITIDYIMEKGFSDLVSWGNEEDIVPLNLSEEYIVQVIGSRDDIEYRDYRIEEDYSEYRVSVTFIFDNIVALNTILPEDNAITLTRDGRYTIFNQGIVSQRDEHINDESLEILKDIYEDHIFTMEVNVPGEIITVENGVKTSTNNALYNEKLLDIITDSNSRDWSIRW